MILKRPNIYYFLCAVIAIPALLINLGIVPFIEDEAIRTLVAYEMQESKQFLTPTLNDQLYYKKPPLWNWVILMNHHLTGQWNEWTSRLPTIFFLFCFVFSIYKTFSRYLTKKDALLLALLFLTSGRILFWDSMLALIDICFSWVMFLMIFNIYTSFQTQNWWKLFLVSYALCAIGFLLKTLPAPVFLGLSLFGYFVLKRSFWKLFSLQHIMGFLLFLGILSLYYIPFIQQNGWQDFVQTLWSENVDRTVISHSIGRVLREMINFPLEMLYHFLLWSILPVFLFLQKGRLKTLWKQDSLFVFSMVIFAINIWVYWSSPIVYPRYLFPLCPFYFYVGFKAIASHPYERYFRYLLLFLSAALVVVGVGSYFHPELYWVSHNVFWSTICTIGLLLVCIEMWRFPKWYLLIFCLNLLVLRVMFNAFILPNRSATTWGSQCKQDAQRIGRTVEYSPLLLYGPTTFRYESSFHISVENGEILERSWDLNSGSYYIVDLKNFDQEATYMVVDSMRTRINKEFRHVVKMK